MKREKKNRTDVIGRKWSSSSSSLYFIPNCGFVKVCQWKPSIYPCSNFFFLSFFYYYYDYFLAKQPIRFLVCLLAYLFIKLGCADTDFFFFWALQSTWTYDFNLFYFLCSYFLLNKYTFPLEFKSNEKENDKNWKFRCVGVYIEN